MNRFEIFGLPRDVQLTGQVMQEGVSKPFDLVYLPAPLPTHPAFGRIGGDISLDITTGFGIGDHYLLETDTAGDIILEPGRDHRTVYFGTPGGADTWDAARIEATGATASASGAWLAGQTLYGGSPEFAITSDLFRSFTQNFWASRDNESVWFLLEGGGSHTMGGAIFLESGQSPLHPMVWGSYGTGQAIIDRNFQTTKQNLKNWVFKGLHFRQGCIINGTVENFLMTDCLTTGHDAVFQATGSGHTAHTIHNSKFLDIAKETPTAPGGAWTAANAGADRYAGAFVAQVTGFLLKNTIWDMCGWERGYVLDETPSPFQAPSNFNHCIYCSEINQDISFVDSILMHGANSGAQLRTGHASRRTIFAENNIAHQFSGPQPTLGNYTCAVHEVVTGSACRAMINTGGIDRHVTGPSSDAYDTVIEGLIVAHGADPNDPAEIAAKTEVGAGSDFSSTRFYEPEYVLYNWLALPDEQTTGLDVSTMDAATLQYWADAEQSASLGTTDMEGVATYLRSLEKPWEKAIDIWNHFAAAFGQYVYTRSTAQIVRFVPSPKGDGFRWDNPINWETGDWAGFVAGDGADLNGYVVTKYDNSVLQSLDLGVGGALTLFGGKTSCTDLAGTGVITCQRAGQLWINGANTGAKTITVEGGRLVVDAQVTGDLSVSISGDAECVIHEGALLTIAADQSLTITGDAAWVGFDGIGDGTAELRLEGTTTFVPGNNGFSPIRTFQSGIHGVTEPSLITTVILGGEINVNLSSVAPGQYDLIDANQLTGTFDTETFTEGLGTLSIIAGRLVLTVT